MMVSVLMFLIFLALGLVFLIPGLNARRADRLRAQRETARTEGVIVRAEKKVILGTRRHGQKAPEQWRCVVRYTAGGREYELLSEGTYPDDSLLTPGKAVEVLYDPDEPFRYHLTQEPGEEKAARTVILLGAGLILLGAALAVIHLFSPLF